MATDQVVNWAPIMLPVLVTVGGGTIAGNMIVAKYKEWLDRCHAIAQRKRDSHLLKGDCLRRTIAAVVGARTAAANARRSDYAFRSANGIIAERHLAKYDRHIDNFERLVGEAIVESEAYGTLPSWCRLGESPLSHYVRFVVGDRLDEVTDSDCHPMNSRDVHGHVRALIADLRSLVVAEESMAHDAYVRRRRDRQFRVPNLPYLRQLSVYFPKTEVNVQELDLSLLDAQEFLENSEREAQGTVALTQGSDVD